MKSHMARSQSKDVVATMELVSRDFAGREVLRNVSLKLTAGELVGVAGPNGGG